MKPSDFFTAVSSVMNRKLRTALAVAAVAICLLPGVGMAQAEPTVIKDGADPSRAIGIQNLNIDGTLYNAQFPFSNAAGIYDPFPGSFTFDNEDAAIAAMEAINDVLSADGNIRKVGCSDCPGSEDYWIGYDSNLEEDPDADDSTELAITGRSGLVPDIPTNEWEIKVTDVVIRYDNRVTWADFTLVPEGGNGNLPPTARPGGPYRGVVGEDVAFDGTGSFDPDGTIDSYEWDFGDGGTAIGPTPAHTYEAPGIYLVTLTVTDDEDVPDSETTTVSIIGRDENQAMADAGGPYFGTVGAAVSFDGTGSTPPDGIETYEWNFGDGESGEGPTPSHRYDVFGEYIVTLKVITEDGVFDMDATTASIGVVTNLPPNADANGPYTGRVGEVITFDGSASSDPDGTIELYEWRFGEGDPPSGATPPGGVPHIYSEPGLYNVILTVTDNDGAKDSIKTIAVISPGNPPLECGGAFPSIDTIWPPNNRRFIPVEILGVTSSPLHSIVIEGIHQDERVGRRPDGRGVGTDTAFLRAQRRPRWLGGNGRVYRIDWKADDGQGNTCEGNVTVAVPLRRFREAIDDGPDFDSTVPSWRRGR